MEWFIMNSSGVRSLAPGLVAKVDEDNYIVQDECADVIDELLEKISREDPKASITKRHLLSERLISKDLIPLIKFASPMPNELALVLRLLSTLCEPVDGEVPHATLQDLTTLTRQVRKAFLDIEFVSKLLHHIKELIEEGGEYELADESYDSIKYLLVLLRNILYCTQHEDSIQQTALKGLLLKNGMVSVITYSINCHKRNSLAVPVAQLLSQLYQGFEWQINIADEKKEETAAARAAASANQYVNNQQKSLIVQLLQGALSTLVISLQKQELKETNGTSYIPLCLSYFLPYINQVPVSVSKISGLLSCKCVGYLVYQVSMLSLNLFSDSPSHPAFQQDRDRVLLIFSALDNLLTTVTNYKLSSLDKDDLKIVMQFYKDLVEMSDLWNILLFYIGNFDLCRFPRSFLSQLVCTNHRLFTAIEFYNQTFSGQLEQTVLDHFKQFAAPKVIDQYTLLVETYATNTELTNMAIFTMLCHICVDCGKIDLLYTPSLLRLLGSLTDSSKATDEDRQLASYVTKSFLDDLTMRPQLCVESFINSTHNNMDTSVTSQCGAEQQQNSYSDWTDVEESELFSLYADVGHDSSLEATVDLLSYKLSQLGINRSKEQVVLKLQQLGIIESSSTPQQPQVGISELVTGIVEDGNEHFISWIHRELLTASFIKASPKDSRCRNSPLCRYSLLKGKPYPLIPYSSRLHKVLSTDSKSRQLLDLLEVPYEPFNGSYIPHIPSTMTAGQLYTVAEHLRSIEAEAIGAKLPQSCDSSTNSSYFEEEELCKKSWETSGPEANNKESALGREGNVWLSYMHNAASS